MSNVFMMILIPVALGIFMLELYFLRKKGYKVTLDQTVLNLSLGFFDRLLGLYLTERSLVLVHEAINYAIIPSMPSNWPPPPSHFRGSGFYLVRLSFVEP